MIPSRSQRDGGEKRKQAVAKFQNQADIDDEKVQTGWAHGGRVGSEEEEEAGLML
jgi:hypothetical protein